MGVYGSIGKIGSKAGWKVSFTRPRPKKLRCISKYLLRCKQ
jgi:hypothetical protein